MQTMTKAATPNYYASSTCSPFPPRTKIKDRVIILTIIFFSYKSLNSQCNGKNIIWKSVFLFVFFFCLLMHKSPK